MTTAWLAGGSGLTGGHLLRSLLSDQTFTKVVSFGRRTLPLEHPKLVQVKVDFGAMQSFDGLGAPNVAFSCLGTTIKKAGSKAAFRAVDYEAVLNFARAADANGARVFLHVSSLGADAHSRTFYSRVKGEIEVALEKVGFESLYAIRPSILDGERAESRPLERLGLAVARALSPLLGKYRPTTSAALAQTLVAKAKERRAGAHIIEADAIR